jgi:acyl-coenzyme A synthetase/AMP-(fatty) acid ligase
VKLNGQRVELSEITCAIENTGLVKQAATVAVRNADATMQLYSFYSSETKDEIKEDIHKSISKILPDYMIPSVIVQLEELPVTATNKID